MCRCHLTALRPTRRALQASAEGFTEGHIAAQFTEPQWPSAFRAFASTLEWIDTAPNISLHQPAAATTYHLSVSRHLIATVSRVRSALAESILRPSDRDRVAASIRPRNSAPRRRAVDLVPRKKSWQAVRARSAAEIPVGCDSETSADTARRLCVTPWAGRVLADTSELSKFPWFNGAARNDSQRALC